MVGAKALEYGAMMDQGQDILENISNEGVGRGGDLRRRSVVVHYKYPRRAMTGP